MIEVENITENMVDNETRGKYEVYSTIHNMNLYRVEVYMGSEFEAYEEDGTVMEDEELAGQLFDAVIKFRKGE